MVGVLLSLNRWTRLLAIRCSRASASMSARARIMIPGRPGLGRSRRPATGWAAATGLQIAARILWGISFAALNLGSLAYAVADRANAGKRVCASRGLIGVIQASCFIGGGLPVLQHRPSPRVPGPGRPHPLLAVVAALMLPPLEQRSDRSARLSPACAAPA